MGTDEKKEAPADPANEMALFRQKMTSLLEAGEKAGNKLSMLQIHELMSGFQDAAGKIDLILSYLQARGIQIEGSPIPSCLRGQGAGTDPVPFPGTRKALSVEEAGYLESTIRALEAQKEDVETDRGQTQGMILAARLAAKWHCEEILLQDLIQEAQMAFFQAFLEDAAREDKWYEERILKGIREAILQQTQQKDQDNALVEKVQKLEDAIQELADEEDGQVRFSAADLAILLDMKEEEINSILRLTE